VAADDSEIDIAAALGAEREASTQVLSLYIPDRDRNGRRTNAGLWIRKAQAILTRIGEGYTPPLWPRNKPRGRGRRTERSGGLDE
jgi:hypothetical protein